LSTTRPACYNFGGAAGSTKRASAEVFVLTGEAVNLARERSRERGANYDETQIQVLEGLEAVRRRPSM
jgi:hypothetical protein